MKKQLILLLFIFQMLLSFSQTKYQTDNYFKGKHLNCKTENLRAKEVFDAGIKVLKLNSNLNPKFLDGNKQLFMKAISLDSTFCDAYFFAGYTSKLQNNFKDAFIFYYLADSLSIRPSLIYKQNLAVISVNVGNIELAENKYSEIVENFKDSPEGYYGIALISLMKSETTKGIINIEKAYELYKKKKIRIGSEVRYVKTILLTQNKEYKKALKIFSLLKTKRSYSKNDEFNAYYSVCLKNIGILENNSKMIKKSKKYAEKVKDKTILKKLSEIHTIKQ